MNKRPYSYVFCLWLNNTFSWDLALRRCCKYSRARKNFLSIHIRSSTWYPIRSVSKSCVIWCKNIEIVDRKVSHKFTLKLRVQSCGPHAIIRLCASTQRVARCSRVRVRVSRSRRTNYSAHLDCTGCSDLEYSSSGGCAGAINAAINSA